jgi:uncharacterized protein (TIGR03067 family)
LAGFHLPITGWFCAPTDTIAKHSMIVIHRVAPPPERSAAKELKRLQGVWQMEMCDSTLDTFGGTQQEASKWQWTIKDDEILWGRQGDVWKVKLHIDPTKSPHEVNHLTYDIGPFEMDLTYLTGPFKGAKCGGIYGFGGVDRQSLMIAIQDPGVRCPASDGIPHGRPHQDRADDPSPQQTERRRTGIFPRCREPGRSGILLRAISTKTKIRVPGQSPVARGRTSPAREANCGEPRQIYSR